MKPITGEWVHKAEGDHATARREVQVVDRPNYDAVCFHAQQCAGKYLKARLVEANVGFPKTHDLGVLLTLLRPIEPAWEWLRPDVVGLSALAVEVRYPGRSPDADDAREAVRIAGEVRRLARNALGIGAE